jgi:hypothetical protein
LARENAWGYTRILGELKKLGVGKISRSTVIKILKDNGLEPGPRRGEGTWDDFLSASRSVMMERANGRKSVAPPAIQVVGASLGRSCWRMQTSGETAGPKR